jgi:hypothetical protein
MHPPSQEEELEKKHPAERRHTFITSAFFSFFEERVGVDEKKRL